MSRQGESGAADGVGSRHLRVEALDWDKGGGLLPAIVQDACTHRVLMLGYMDRGALQATLDSGQVHFHSRSRARLWRKGEQSGNTLELATIEPDCDADALLVRVRPRGPTCHLGRTSCFEHAAGGGLAELDRTIGQRWRQRPVGSYTTQLAEAGIARIAQKVGEEAVETAIAAVAADDASVLGEAADLAYHLLVLLHARGMDLAALEAVLRERHAGPDRASSPMPHRIDPPGTGTGK
ncbi:bifunctional phosphoribosyl-AMP cyclohydrolase/phosphoribosyl-ATP diphosphatase HisIE [Luteimonas vadosa]|uniref:Histidine biosynthesis bifunctional protein HisIE n=1 Tax=Luteimonas vadosa TaxID=1165507 RepID=A0ABP9E4K4_9GAMM